RVESRDVDYGRAICAVALDRENSNDRRIHRLPHGAIYGKSRVCGNFKCHAAKKNSIAFFLPAKNALGELIATESISTTRARETPHKQHVLVELAAGDFIVQSVADAMCSEKSI